MGHTHSNISQEQMEDYIVHNPIANSSFKGKRKNRGDTSLLRSKILKICKNNGYDDIGLIKLNELMEDYMEVGLRKQLELIDEEKVLLNERKLKVKFIVSYRHITKTEEVFSGILGIFQKNYGPVHTCIQIGPYVLHFFNNGLVHIGTFKTANALLALDVCEFEFKREEGKRFDKTISAIIELVEDYNMNKEYNLVNCNCQHFVDDILAILGIHSLEKYFKKKEMALDIKKVEKYTNMITKENDRILFRKLKVTYLFNTMIKESKLLFDTHVKLDVFVDRLMNDLYPDKDREDAIRIFQNEFPIQYDILKSCDRAFWLKFENDLYKIENTVYIDKSNCNYPHIDDNAICQCPFDSPVLTGTIDQGNIFCHTYTRIDPITSCEGIVRVLNLCGTGLRCFAILGMLKTMERHTEKSIHELFDVITGSSISGVIALAISQEIPLSKIEKFCNDILDRNIIPKEFGDKVYLKKEDYIRNDFYNPVRLENCICELFGENESKTPLNKSKKNVIVYIPVMRVSSSRNNVILLNQNIGSDAFTLGNTARLSMCQYQYFGNTTIDKYSYHSAVEKVCNPIENVLLALDAYKKFSNRKLLIVSLGGGRLPNDEYASVNDYYQLLLHQKPFDVLHSTFASQYLNRGSHIEIMRWILSTKACKMVTYYRFDPISQFNDEYFNKSEKTQVFQAIAEEAIEYLESDNSYLHFLNHFCC